MALLGAHMSVAGGLHLAFAQIRQVQGQALQIFTRNQRQWRAAPITAQEALLFAEAWQAAGQIEVAAHDSYLINLASPNKETAQKSIDALADELLRCAALRIPYLVMHPGAHLGDGVEAGLARFSRNLDLVFTKAATATEVMVLLETTAGQGTSLGAKFEELAAIIGATASPHRLGVCLDTCHVFAAGYDLRTAKAQKKIFADFDKIIGIDRLKFFHLNDSIKELGSRVDRHTHIGQGQIGIEGFRLLLNNPEFRNHPMVLETPKDKDLTEDMENLKILRAL
ncbi:MAG: deoxyribonuclease IV [Desulfobulbaceae bacterium]|nr:deoxyribonuclease IV [Desulfobulbaceae bacterium]HIJ78995.1 deoxyribonuclease IV [Deltaproteobacteria bacterium]